MPTYLRIVIIHRVTTFYSRVNFFPHIIFLINASITRFNYETSTLLLSVGLLHTNNAIDGITKWLLNAVRSSVWKAIITLGIEKKMYTGENLGIRGRK